MSVSGSDTGVHGQVADGWGAVADELAASVERGDDTGASVAVYHRGRCVVDVAAGSFDAAGSAPYDQRTLQLVFSTTKGITAIAVAMCMQRGLLRYDDAVAAHWPEFAAEGKGDATVAQLLSHQCGLITADGLSLDEALDWDTVTARLAAGAPEWPIGTGHGYHALTFGWLAGELVRRVDGRSLGRFVADEIAGPLGVELWIGLPESEAHRVSPLIGGLTVPDDLDPAVKAMIDQVMGPETRGGRALSMSGAFSVDGAFNRRDVHAAEIPAANCITRAGALAKVYAATLQPIDGVELIDHATRELIRTQVTPPDEPDLCLLMPTTFGMGFMTHGLFTPYAGPGSYGHPGAGGSVAFAQPERELAFAYAMNTMSPNLAGDLRAQRLIDAVTTLIDTAA
ncbi:serine hydrolase domain-containing protein [soil metagenome]